MIWLLQRTEQTRYLNIVSYFAAHLVLTARRGIECKQRSSSDHGVGSICKVRYTIVEPIDHKSNSVYWLGDGNELQDLILEQ